MRACSLQIHPTHHYTSKPFDEHTPSLPFALTANIGSHAHPSDQCGCCIDRLTAVQWGWYGAVLCFHCAVSCYTCGFLRTRTTESPRRNSLEMNRSLLMCFAFFFPFPTAPLSVHISVTFSSIMLQ